ncbi:MAG TPA: hypothetical protein VJ183_09435 [Chloroflexia bacterium]|nr:hypothetical protein [Chloroflexia bacterium]
MWRGVRIPRFYALLLGSLLLWTLAYQYKVSYTVDLGGLYDDGYVAGFHGKEINPEHDYRWSMAVSSVTFPGIGNEPVFLSLATTGNRLGGPAPMLTVEARGKSFIVQTSSTPHTDTIFLDRGNAFDSDLVVTLSSPVFSPPGDERELGVIVDRITVAPADYGLRPLVVPALGTIMGMLAGLIATYLVGIVTLQRVRYALLAGGVLAIIFAGLVVTARMELGLWGWQLPGLAVLAVLLALSGRTLLDALMSSTRQDAAVAGIGSAAFVAAFILRFGGLIYPQFLSSDLLFQAHRMQDVMGGKWVFPSALPDGTPVPYPPALYVVLSPLGLLFGTSDETLSVILKVSMALLDSATCLALAWAGWRLWGRRVGGLAALVYALSPAPFELFSAGNYTNLFAQGVLNLTLLGWLVYLGREELRHRWLWVSVLSAGFALMMLGHYGMMLAALPIIGFFGLWTLIETIRGSKSARSWHLILGFVVSLVGSFALYYRHFIQDIWNQFSALFGRLGGGKTQEIVDSELAPLRQQPLYEKLLGKVGNLVGLPATLSALLGFFLPDTRLDGKSVEAGSSTVNRQARALIVSWLGAAVLFLLLDQTLGDSVRWYYLAAAVVALLAGRFLAALSSKGRTAQVLVGLVLSVMLLHLLTTWVGDLIFTRYHETSLGQ